MRSKHYKHTISIALIVNSIANTAGIDIMGEKKSFWQLTASLSGLVEVVAIVCMPEVDTGWQRELEPLRKKYPHSVEVLEFGNFGMACYTRLQLKSSRTQFFADDGIPSIVLELEHEGRPLTFIGTHPPPPMGSRMSAIWRTQFKEIAKLASVIHHDVIVAGDFNATPWSHGMHLLFNQSDLGFRSTAPVWRPTWGLSTPMMIPIDHIVLSSRLVILKHEVGPDVGSDHRSVLVNVH